MKKLVLGIILTTMALSGCGADDKKSVLEKAVKINARITPFQVDDVTLLTLVSSDGDTLTYHYTVSHIDESELSQEDADDYHNDFIDSGCSTTKFSDIFNVGGKVKFSYRDTDDNYLFKVDLSKEICKSPEKYKRPVS